MVSQEVEEEDGVDKVEEQWVDRVEAGTNKKLMDQTSEMTNTPPSGESGNERDHLVRIEKNLNGSCNGRLPNDEGKHNGSFTVARGACVHC